MFRHRYQAIPVALAALCLLTLAAGLRAQEPVESKIAVEYNIYADGSTKVNNFVYDELEDRYVRSLPGDFGPAADERTFSSAIVDYILLWHGNTKKIVFSFTEESIGYRKAIKKIMNAYVKKRRGTGNMPKPKPSKNVLDVHPLEEYNNIWEYRAQFENDDNSVIVMTSDDNFFRGSNGQLLEPDLIGRTWVYASAMIKQINGTWRGTYFIEEADIFLRSDYFQQPTYIQRVVMTGLLRYGYGYQKPIWTWDINADHRTFSEDMFENAKHTMWTDIAQEWDRLFYQDKITGPGYLDTVHVLPVDDSVLDLAEYEVPDTDPQNPNPTNRSDALIFTNLKAYDGNKKLTAVFTAVYDDAAAPAAVQKKKILTISGNQYGWPRDITVNGSPDVWYPTIVANVVKLGRQQDLDDLNDAIEQYGTPMNVGGADYDKALKVELKITGYLTENGKKKQKTVTVYLVNSENQ